MSHRMKFGVFLAPFHKPGINPTLALEQDLELVQWLDRCGYDEAWCGEHHSAGTEISASPEIFMAVASQRTKHIKLGSGVTSVSYHNPLWVAERIVQLDHLTRGRVMLGLGPGSLPSDGIMVGLSQTQTRPLLEEGLDIIMRLLTTDEPVTFKNDRWDLRDARLHLRPYSNPLFDVAIPAVASPTGPKLAGRYGCGLLSIGATTAAGFDALALHWDVMEAQAAHYKTKVDRNKWRLVGMVHCAETMDQAYRDVEYGMAHWFDYFQAVAAFPQMAVPGSNVKEMISLRQRVRLRRHRHARHGQQADRPAVEAEQRRLRRLPDAGAQLGQLRRHPQELRPDRAPCLPAVAGADEHAGRGRPRPRRPARAGGHPQPGGGSGHPALRGRNRRPRPLTAGGQLWRLASGVPGAAAPGTIRIAIIGRCGYSEVWRGRLPCTAAAQQRPAAR
jgi:limonene 1,2-monooxygenase